MALPQPKGKASWIALARLRVMRVLEVRVAATIRQLEVKICESGPPKKRPQPHVLVTAIANMVRAGELVPVRPVQVQHEEHETEFYTLPEFHPEQSTARIRQVLVHYRMHRSLARTQEYCGDVLEQVVESTFAAAGPDYQYLGRLPDDGSGALDGVWQFNGHRLPAAAGQWEERKGLLETFAVHFELGVGRIDDQTRNRRYREFSRVVFPRPQPAELEDHPDEDPGDEYDEEFGGFDEDHW